jgi:CRP-like cAMP-binding protein
MDLQELVNNAPENIKKEFIYRKYKKGSFIIQPYEENNYLYILIDGSAEVYRQNYAGTMISLYLYNSYSCFGEVEIFNNNIKTLGVIAKINCETITIHKKNVFEWMRTDFNFTFYIVEQLAAKLISSSDVTSKLSFLIVKDRILCSIYAHYKIGDLDSLTKQLLSSEVCTPIRSLNRSISQCINEKYIDFKEKKFTVNSIEKLENYVENLI